MRSLIHSLIIAAITILGTAAGTESVMADPVVVQLASLSGTVNPVTYTIPQGTFTTSIINLTLNTSSPSFFTIDEGTGVITAHTVMDVFFNNGRGTDLSGTIIVDETGTLGPQPILMHITNGIVIGAGEFAGTRIFGDNPTFFDPFITCLHWDFSPPDSPPFVFLDLPPGFINGDSVPIHGHCDACAAPEPATLVLLGTGLAGFSAAVRKRRRE